MHCIKALWTDIRNNNISGLACLSISLSLWTFMLGSRSMALNFGEKLFVLALDLSLLALFNRAWSQKAYGILGLLNLMIFQSVAENGISIGFYLIATGLWFYESCVYLCIALVLAVARWYFIIRAHDSAEKALSH